MEEFTVEELREAALDLDEQGLKKEAAELLDRAELLEAQQAAAAAAERPSMIEDVARAAPASLARGAAEGAQIGPNILDFMTAGLPAALAEAVFGAPKAAPKEKTTFRDMLADVTGGASEYQAQTIPGEYTQTIGEFMGGAATLPIGGPLRAMGSAILPGIASETAGQLTKGTELEGPARMIAALGTPFVQAAGTPIARRLAIGDPADVRAYQPGSKRTESVETLREAGVTDIKAGQQLGSPQLMTLEGSTGPSLQAQGQLTKAVLREAGADADLATGDVLKATRDRIGSVFDEADAMAGGAPLPSEGQRMIAALREAEDSISVGKVPNKLVKIVEDFSDAAVKGVDLDPRNVAKTRKDLNKAMSTYAADGDMINYELAYDMLQTLDDTVARQIKDIDPGFMDTLSNARNQYRAFLTLERAINRAGPDAAAGYITPAALASALRRREGASYMRGTGSQLAELGRASQEVLSSMPTVLPGGERRVGSLGQMVTEFVPGMVARRAQETLPLPARQAIGQRLLERLARQTGGILAID